MKKIKELDRIITKDGRVGTVMGIWFDTTGVEVEFDDNVYETETIDITDIEKIHENTNINKKENIENKKICKCCGKYELDINSIFQICPICGWESDPIQEDNPDYKGGANKESLKEYKEKYKKMRGTK